MTPLPKVPQLVPLKQDIVQFVLTSERTGGAGSQRRPAVLTSILAHHRRSRRVARLTVLSRTRREREHCEDGRRGRRWKGRQTEE
ncbi:hypothetical protein F2P81_005145 [Scophthalmus maximus]|uniref:Uncharacterized protein n=1 Tax=Scophthalmus maximus TaxID=52904 RepID=A0A6A4T6H7_SCOMX|nr:hypothetical protein F2P81_005145 [Scophthalmus maximus]